MAISEVCKFEVKEEIDRYIQTEGISRNEASKKLAAFYTDILGIEVKPETIRQKDYRVRRELATNVTTENWPRCKKCRTGRVKQGKYVGTGEPGEWGGEIIVPAPASHGLCDSCRKKELREQREKKDGLRIKREQEEFDQIPVDAESDQFWNELSDRILVPLNNDGIPCNKVSEEVLSKINSWFTNLREYVRDVSENSTRPSKYR
jgi:hypothetical protein